MCLKVRVHALRHAYRSQLIVPFYSMNSIICSRSLLDLYQYYPGLLGFSFVQVTPQPPSPASAAEYL